MKLPRGLSLGLMAAGLVFLTQQSALAEKLVFAHDWVPYGKHASFYVAAVNGYYKSVGMDVKVIRGHGSADTVKRVLAKEPDFGLADTPAVIIGRSRAGSVKIIGIFADEGMNVIYSLKRSGIKAPKDLSGREVGDAQGGACISIFPALAKLNGIKGWKHSVMRPAVKNPTLLAGKVDAICTFVTVGVPLRFRAKKIGVQIAEMRFSDWGLDLYGASLITVDETIRKNPGRVRRFMEGTMKAMAWTVENTDAAMKVFLRLHPASNPTLTRLQWDVAAKHLMTPYAKKNGIGSIDAKKMANTRDLVVKYRSLKNSPKVEDIFTNKFLPKLFPKYSPAS